MKAAHRNPGMSVEAAVRHLCQLRGERDVVVTNQSSARLWPWLSQHPLDFHYNPSTMGGAIPLALGLALAQPEREILVVSGDGSLLMSLGSLVTVAASRAGNLSIVLLDNAMYEVTGGQATPAGESGVDYGTLAAAAGFPAVIRPQDLAEWQSQAATWLQSPGPRLAWLRVGPTPREAFAHTLPPLSERVREFQQQLGVGAARAPRPVID